MLGGFCEDPESAGAAQPPEDRLKVKGTNQNTDRQRPQHQGFCFTCMHASHQRAMQGNRMKSYLQCT